MHWLKSFFQNVGLFFKGATDFKGRAYEMLQVEVKKDMDNFMLICFADQLGIPLPVGYYTLELLPYLIDEMADWEIRMTNRKSVWAERWSDYNMDP